MRLLFYNEDLFAITPMGFCFPGQDKHGGDLPPRKECAPLWQDELTTHLTGTRLTLLVGRNNVWIKKHDWFQEELIALKTRIGELLG